jgi:hypothetical protein
MQGPFNHVLAYAVPVALDFGMNTGLLNMGAGAVLYLQKIVSGWQLQSVRPNQLQLKTAVGHQQWADLPTLLQHRGGS